jgi:ribokinase
MTMTPPSLGDSRRHSRVVVAGSLNHDVFLRVATLPRRGETVLAYHRHETQGGKGANQAVAAARAGARVAMIGACGIDEAGEGSMAALSAEGIDISHVVRFPDAHTGEAVVVVDESGENQIVVAPGANALLDDQRVREAMSSMQLSAWDVVLVSFEIPDAAVTAAVDEAFRYGARIVINPAPARALNKELIARSPVLIPNETEAVALTGSDSPHDAALQLGAITGAPVIVSLGSQGAVCCIDQRTETIPALAVKVIDTTGAGDTLAGAFAAALAANADVPAAARRAIAAASLSVRARGVREGMPTAAEIDNAAGTITSPMDWLKSAFRATP